MKRTKCKRKIRVLEDYQARNTVVNPNIDDVDVFGMTSDETVAYVNFFKIRNGNIVQKFHYRNQKMLEETDEEILEEALIEIRQKFALGIQRNFASFSLNIEIPNIKLIVPKSGR